MNQHYYIVTDINETLNQANGTNDEELQQHKQNIPELIQNKKILPITPEEYQQLKEKNKDLQKKIKNFVKKTLQQQKEYAKEHTIHTSQVITDEIIAEQCHKEGKNYFYLLDRKNGEIKEYDKIQINGMTYKPVSGDEINKKVILLPTKPEEYGTEEELEKEIITHIHTWLDIPPDYERQAMYNIKLSWVYEKFYTLNYTRAIGDTGVGKSRFLNVLGHLHYKPMIVAGSLTAAVIFRMINKWKGTLLIDEGDQTNSDETNAFIKIMNCGYEKGMSIARCDKNDPNKLEFFEVFCPKVLTTRSRFDDKATEARCMTIIMTQTNRTDIPEILYDEYWTKTQQLRNKLLMWKFLNYDKINPEASRHIDLSAYEPRLRQVNRSFISLFAHDEVMLQRFLHSLDEYQENLIEERSQTIEGSIINAIAQAFQDKNITEEGLSPSEIKNFINQADYKYPISEKKINKIIKNMGLNFKRCWKNNGTKNCLQYEFDHIFLLFKKYVHNKELLNSIQKFYNITLITDITLPGVQPHTHNQQTKTDILKKNCPLYTINRNNCNKCNKCNESVISDDVRNIIQEKVLELEQAEIEQLIKIEGVTEQIIEKMLKEGELMHVTKNGTVRLLE